MAHVLLETGANWSGLPLQAMSCYYGPNEWEEKEVKDLCPWAAMGSDIEAWDAKYLEGMEVTCFRSGWKGRHTGIIVDWSNGFDRYPQEQPTSRVGRSQGQRDEPDRLNQSRKRYPYKLPRKKHCVHSTNPCDFR